MAYLMLKSVAQALVSDGRMTVKNRCGTDVETVMEKSELLSQHFHERTEGNQKSSPPRSG